ncbi:protease complex subunit PrcB family protein [Thalassotalea mangrovi]|uniref:Protease complex subunit PrcB family protein n=1 Tax=Thalassotalea mangrovi TaxID=2572245 RepID=A0A4U1B5E4_9GAMM|nr:protease complex subunit PrcB family protein [Thalassotalea mangrovi]TKB45569.1 protease complex subunit PrcB family protein [Thalassotalea mangrovi]
MTQSKNGIILLLFSCTLLFFTANSLAAKRSILYQVLYQDSEYYDDNAFGNKSIKVIRDWNTYADEVIKHTQEAIIDVNFSESQVVVIDMGNRPNTGYGVKISSVLEFDDYIVVYTKFSVGDYSSGECLPGEAITNPIVILKINSQKEIIVREKYKSDPC